MWVAPIPEAEQSHGRFGHPQKLQRLLRTPLTNPTPWGSFCADEQNIHRVTEQVREEGTTLGHLFPPPCPSRVTPEHRVVSRGFWNISGEGGSTPSTKLSGAAGSQ